MPAPAGSRRNVLALIGAVILLGGCFAGSPFDRDQTDSTMTVEEFQTDIKSAVVLAEQYWAAQFQAAGRPFAPIDQVFAYQKEGEVTCAGEPVPLNNAVYCPAADFIAYDINWAIGAFRQIGDAFVYYLLGHEYAHGMQVRMGIRYEYTIEQELQADCMAGAYIGDSVKASVLSLAPGDLDEFKRGLLVVGDDPNQPWFAPDAHGTAQQRADAFFGGYERSLAACGLA